MRAAGIRVRSEGSTSSLFTGTVSPVTNRSEPSNRRSGSQGVFLPVSAMFDDAPPAVSCQDTPVRSVRSKRVRSEGSTSSLFTGTVSPATNRSEPSKRRSGSQAVILPVSAMFDEAPLAVSYQDTPVRSVRSKKTAQTEKSLFAGSVSTEMSLKTRATANTSVRVHSCFASDEIPNSLAAARDPGGDEHR